MAQTTEPVCIKVPKPGDPNRSVYDALSHDRCIQRREWYSRCCDVYVGRPKCDGGWYHVPEVKKGSIFSNPFTLKEYSLEESLERYQAYLQLRLSPTATIEDCIERLPTGISKLLQKRFVERKANAAKSVAHYELDVRGEQFRERLLQLRGKRVGCWCDNPVDGCHAGTLARMVEALSKDSVKRERPQTVEVDQNSPKHARVLEQ